MIRTIALGFGSGLAFAGVSIAAAAAWARREIGRLSGGGGA